MKNRMVVYSLAYCLLIGLTVFLTPIGQLSANASLPADEADRTLEQVIEQGRLVIGSDIPYGVMEYLDDTGEPAGIDIDIARMVASEIGVELDVKMMPFDDLFDSLARKEIDAIVSAVTITPERQKEMLFSIPYMDAGMSLAVAMDNTEIKGEPDLQGRRVGVLAGTVGEELMRKSPYVDEENLRIYKINADRISDLVTGKIDAAIVHFIASDLGGLKILEPPLTQSFYGIVTRLECQSLMKKVNQVLRSLKRTGELDEIRNRHIRR